MAMSCKDGKPGTGSLDNGKYVRECPILSNIEPKQIKVWFQNRRYRERQRKEESRFRAVNRKLTAMNKLLMEENDRLQKQVSQLAYDNDFCRQHTQNSTLAIKDPSCESLMTSGQHCVTQQNPPRDASPAGLLSIAEETLAEFLSKATGTAIEWVQMPRMKPGSDSIGIIAISHGCPGVAARACGLVGLEPTRVAELLKDRPSWFRDCRAVDVLNVLPAANGGTIELLYAQLYAPTTLAPARYFWLLRYTSVLEDGSLVVCERSLKNTQNGPSMPSVQHFVRAEMFVSGYLIRPCEGGDDQQLYGHLTRGWSMMGNDGMDDVTMLVNSSPDKLMGLNLSFANGFPSVSNSVLCAKASMLLQNVPPAILLRFLREHRSEWADSSIDEYSAAVVKVGPCSLRGGFGSKVILPLAHTIEHEESLEVIKLEGIAQSLEDALMPRDVFLLQLCSGMDENAVGTCAEIIFAPIDTSFADDAPLLPSGFRIIPLGLGKQSNNSHERFESQSFHEITSRPLLGSSD
ncbi:Homeobox-leucine zipper protein HOX32 [Hibiscus syriacus]|uniref:Homeobox-leucine zipper protein HOX32 n=1 Tax=Hibiscus syriacus TaxID=106335 RepID=A0A6A3A9L4_HIBSY|nr:Homeobox-leucine zipper protein HOX32 [Hibiscus syriacus]